MLFGLAIVGLLSMLIAVWAAYELHRSWKLYASISRDWRRRAEQYAESAARLSRERHEHEDGAAWSAHADEVVELLRSHDLKGLGVCAFHAVRWAERIPVRLRTYYLPETRE